MRIVRSLTAAGLALTATLMPIPAMAQDSAEVAVPAVERPAATLADMAWLQGSWVGKGIGGHPAGETFSYAGDGQMLGHFWQMDADGDIDFYELITITPDGESLTMRLKHFTADMTGWEEKEGDAALEFPLRERSADRWKFGPVTFTLDGPDKLNVSVSIRQSDGSLGSFDFHYDRISPDPSAD